MSDISDMKLIKTVLVKVVVFLSVCLYYAKQA